MSDLTDEVAPAEVGSAKMPAEFGLATATFVIVASMVGVGVLTASGFTVYAVGSNQLMLLLWVVGGVIAVCGALTLCELSAALPRTGGDYVYLHEAYGPLAAFLSGWVSFLIGFSAPSASAAFGAAKFLLVPLHLDDTIALPVQRGVATLAILIFATIHTLSRRQTARIQGWITALKLALLGLFVIAGLAVGWPRYANLNDRPPMTEDTAVAMMFSLVYISYAYIGWNASSYLAGEIRDPQRQLPRAILMGTAGVVVLYLGLNVVYALALSAGDIRAIVEDPNNHLSFKAEAVAPIAQLAARRLFGLRWSDPLSVAIGLMLLSSLSAYVLTGPRVVYAMAEAGQFPAFAGRLTRRAGTPLVATVLQVVCTLALLWTGSFDSLVVYASVGLAIFSMLAIAAVYVLRVKRPDLHRPFRTPGYPVTPAVFLVLTTVLTLATFKQRARVSTYALLSILAGIPIYYIWRGLRRSAGRGVA
jgi:APA family basic amino acid/polyamine antiporter